MPELSQDDLTLLRMCFYERIRAIKRMRYGRSERLTKWTRDEMNLALFQITELAHKFGMKM